MAGAQHSIVTMLSYNVETFKLLVFSSHVARTNTTNTRSFESNVKAKSPIFTTHI